MALNQYSALISQVSLMLCFSKVGSKIAPVFADGNLEANQKLVEDSQEQVDASQQSHIPLVSR